MIRLKYGNTNTFFIPGHHGGLLIDTDYAGTMPAFYREIKNHGIGVRDIAYVMATHYHPDHMGLIGELTEQGVRLLLIDIQVDAVHISDRIFTRDKRPVSPIDESRATVISCEESEGFLHGMGISGKIVRTSSHSKDSVSLIMDNGDCFAGDLEPIEYLDAYNGNEALRNDWNCILSCHPRRIFYAHAPEKILLP